ncbi:MAG: hypothetical protein MI866_00900 [Bacteroidales bacterium]|nr:hypothetical protein [Bacteroidales bacterium]
MTTVKRNYKVSSVDMLIASQVVVKHLDDNIEELSAIRSNWTPEYVRDLQARIQKTTENYLGVNSKQQQKDATEQVIEIHNNARRDVSFLKTQIEADFGSNASSILSNLGIKSNIRSQLSSQEKTIELLYAIEKGMDASLKNQIVNNGTNPALIDRIIEYAAALREANINQETLKRSTKGISAEAQQAFNSIYTEVMNICKIASVYYHYDTLKREKFTFSKVVSAMNAPKRANKKLE